MHTLKRWTIPWMVLSMAACGGASTPAAGSPAPTSASSSTPLTSELSVVSGANGLPRCAAVGYPTAPEDWYTDSPLYVGNEMPIDEVQAFASTLAGYENVWIDRQHNGWITVGFVDADVTDHQAALEVRFPDVGVVAVDMPYTRNELNRIRQQIAQALPEGMNAANIDDVAGVVVVWVGRLTAERVATAEEAVGKGPVCLDGLDPATSPEPGPQAEGGEGWIYLTAVDSMVRDRPSVVADAGSLLELWEKLHAVGRPPLVDFDSGIVVGFSVLHSSSCPETRLDDVVVEGDLVYPIISHLSETACTDDGVPRTYLIAIQRDRLPEPPFRISVERGAILEVLVTADLRRAGSVPADGEIEEVTRTRPRTATPTPLVIETGFPWPFTLDLTCGIEYLGVINDVGWHSAGNVDAPVEWADSAVDGLLDLELLMAQGPESSLTATAGGRAVLYLPGPGGDPCE